jgi:RNA polymerase sigma-70 factor (ECF subfamily)
MEPDLRARVRAGDHDAFGVLFDENARAVCNLGFRLTGDWSAAEEVVSLTFLEAWRKHAQIDPDGGDLRPWLFGIAVNVSRNLSRAARRYQAAMSRLPPPSLVPDVAEEVAGRLDDGAAVRDAVRALARLSRAERELIALCVWSGLDYASAAQVLGLPVGTVRSRLSRARRKLRAALPARWEPANGCEQVRGDRDNAARSAPEVTR